MFAEWSAPLGGNACPYERRFGFVSPRVLRIAPYRDAWSTREAFSSYLLRSYLVGLREGATAQPIMARSGIRTERRLVISWLSVLRPAGFQCGTTFIDYIWRQPVRAMTCKKRREYW